MNENPIEASAAAQPGLTQWQRIANTFSSPSRTFDDIHRGNRSWWLPLILMAIAGYLFFAVVDQKIGIRQAVDNQIRMSPKTEERLAQLTPEQRERSEAISVQVTEGVFYAVPLVGMLEIAVLSLVMLGTINMLFGGKAKFGGVFAVYYYAFLPQLFKVLLGIVVIFAGVAPESFNLKNYAPTNLGAFLDPADTSKALYSLASSVDLITIWTLVLLSIGLAAVAGLKRKSGYSAVFGWWAIVVLISAGYAAALG
jgi:hypothetical protein